jgi:hypothetical protein
VLSRLTHDHMDALVTDSVALTDRVERVAASTFKDESLVAGG